MKKTYIKNIKPGESVNDIFALTSKTLSQKKDGNNFYNITISDKTGSLKGVIWDNIDHIMTFIDNCDFVNISGNVSEYRGVLQIIVKEIKKVLQDSVDVLDFLPQTSKNIDTMFERLINLVNTSIEKIYFKNLLYIFFEDDNFSRYFKLAPAAKKMHHAYIGGLLEHSLSTALLADKIADHYSGICKDILITASILHDIGKVKEFEYKYKIDYSDEGRLLSHIVIGLEMLNEKIALVDNFPEKEALLLKHMVISHHGIRAFGSPEPPKTLEAVLLNYVDEIDSKIHGIREFMDSENNDNSWTSYHRIHERFFYKG